MNTIRNFIINVINYLAIPTPGLNEHHFQRMQMEMIRPNSTQV